MGYTGKLYDMGYTGMIYDMDGTGMTCDIGYVYTGMIYDNGYTDMIFDVRYTGLICDMGCTGMDDSARCTGVIGGDYCYDSWCIVCITKALLDVQVW